MSIQVKVIDENAIKKRLKDNGDVETLNYIRALQDLADRWKDLANKAIGKLKDKY